MPRIAAALAGLCLSLALTACNRVVTTTPVFSVQDAASAPKLRDGLWMVEGETVASSYDRSSGDDEVCVFDMRRPVTRWPDCAEWVLVRDGEILHPGGAKKAKPEWQSTPMVLAAGDPLILQAGMIDEEDPAETEYGYFGITVTQADERGRVIAFDHWMTLCGPPPPQGKGEATRYLTWDLLPGLTAEGDNCTTASKDAVRGATVASRAWSKGRSSLRWVRDSYP